jgi:PAS domain S-box-containing protein
MPGKSTDLSETQHSKTTYFSTNFSTILLVLVGLIGALLVFNWTAKEQQLHAQKNFEDLGQQVAISLERQIRRSEDALTAIVAFFAGSNNVKRSQFQTFVSKAMSDYIGIQALEWIPRVSSMARNTYERAARQNGFEDFSIRQIGDGGMVTATRRAEYYPVFYVEPLIGNQKVLGFDLASNPVRKAALEQARDSGMTVASARITLIQETGKQAGVLVFAPMYGAGDPPQSIDERRRAVSGFALGVFRIGDILDASVSKTAQQSGLIVALYDVSDTNNLQPLHLIGIDNSAPWPEMADLVNGQFFEQTHTFGDRQWRLIIAPKTGTLPIEQPWIPWLAASVILLILILISFYVQLIVRRREFAETLVKERTRELDFQKLALDEHAIVSITDVKGNITYANDAFCEISGFSRDELLGQNHRIVKSDEHSPEFYKDLWQSITNGKIWHGELKNLKKGGGYYWIKATIVPFLNEQGKPFQYVAIRTDITERKKAEETLYDTTERLLSSQQIAHVGSWDWDITNDTRSWTDEIFNIIGRERDNYEATSENFLQCVHPDDRDLVTSAVNQAVENDTPYDIEHRIVQPDGSTRFVHEMGRVYRDDDGTPVRLLGIVHDITERTLLDKAKNEFVSTVSHELRTPLTSIKGSLGLIKSGTVGKLPEKLQSMLDIAYNNSDRLVLLINDILDMEKIKAGKMDFHMKPTDIISLIEDAINANKGYGDEHGVTFTCRDCDENLLVRGDKDRLMQALTNIMSNAAKFSKNGELVELSGKRLGKIIRIAVKDNGQGIPEDFRDSIFDKFSQADSSDTRQKGGTGLGLSITKAIIEHHEGTIFFDTETGKGTTFYIDLPELEERSAQSEIKDYGQSRILICEDEGDIATLLEMMLANAGYKTQTARTAAQARQMLEQKNYDAMTLDLNLPDQDGISLIQELRSDAKTQNLPIIVVSATAGEGKQELNGDAVGLIDWIEKPIDTALLVKRVGDALRHSSPIRPRILHVEDDESIIKVISSLIDDTGSIVPAMTIREARDQLEREIFDLVILDLTLPDGDGSELLPLLNKTGRASVPVIVFSAGDVSRETAENISAALVKSQTSNDELLNTIRSVIETTQAVI